jgi:hypothetical protein
MEDRRMTKPFDPGNDYRRANRKLWDEIAARLDTWEGFGRYYHRRLAEIYRFLIPPCSSVLEIGYARGDLLDAVSPSYGVGVDHSAAMIGRATASLVLALLAPQNRSRASWSSTLGPITFMALFVLQSAALFMTWTPVGKLTIAGMQGRYLLPVLPLLGWASPAYSPPRERVLMWTWYPILLFPLLSLMVTPFAIMVRYYGNWSAMAGSLQIFLLR